MKLDFLDQNIISPCCSYGQHTVGQEKFAIFDQSNSHVGNFRGSKGSWVS